MRGLDPRCHFRVGIHNQAKDQTHNNNMGCNQLHKKTLKK